MKRHPDTQLVHGPAHAPQDPSGAVVAPVHLTSSWRMGSDPARPLRYQRLGNAPDQLDLEHRIASLCGGDRALLFASGMAAIGSTLFALLKQGDALLVSRTLYGGTQALLDQDLGRFGVLHHKVDATRPETWAAALSPSCRVFYVEALSNPLLELPELEAVVAFCRAHGLLSVIDATFATPLGLRPMDLGFDVELHSATKAMGGHSDLIAGVVIGQDEVLAPISSERDRMGGHLDPLSVFLLGRGMKTLSLRFARQNDTALALARAMRDHPALVEVCHPGLQSHPSHARAQRLMPRTGGMLALRCRSGAAAEATLQHLKIAISAPSLGGVETLVSRPVATSHAGLTEAAQRALGLDPGLLRVSCGIEDADDLIADFRQALDAASALDGRDR